MNVERRLRDLLNVVLDEVRQNPAFADRLAGVLGDHASPRRGNTPALGPISVSRAGTGAETTPKRGNRRAAALVHPIIEIEQGELHLRNLLATLNLEQLRDVVAEYGMDPNKLVMKWKARDRVIDHIVATAASRARKGDAFRT
jgi:hypothetical protein